MHIFLLENKLKILKSNSVSYNVHHLLEAYEGSTMDIFKTLEKFLPSCCMVPLFSKPECCSNYSLSQFLIQDSQNITKGTQRK